MLKTTPVLPWQVQDGRNYWAAWGSKGWSAVRVIAAKRKWAEVERVDAKTNETKSRRSKVRVDELVRRDPKLAGKDRPTAGPAAVFASVRRLRAEEQAVEEKLIEEPVEAQPTATKPPSGIEWTEEKWNEFLRKTWTSTFGEGAYEECCFDDDW